MSSTLYLLTICLPLATVLIVFGMKYLSAVQQARARAADSESTRALAAIQASLADLGARLGRIEKMLKDVE